MGTHFKRDVLFFIIILKYAYKLLKSVASSFTVTARKKGTYYLCTCIVFSSNYDTNAYYNALHDHSLILLERGTI